MTVFMPASDNKDINAIKNLKRAPITILDGEECKFVVPVATWTTPLTFEHTTLDISTINTKILEEDRDRKYLLLQNISDIDVYISLGVNAQKERGIVIKANGGEKLFKGETNFIGEVFAIHSGVDDKMLLITIGR